MWKLLSDKNVSDYESLSSSYLTFKVLFICRIFITLVCSTNNYWSSSKFGLGTGCLYSNKYGICLAWIFYSAMHTRHEPSQWRRNSSMNEGHSFGWLKKSPKNQNFNVMRQLISFYLYFLKNCHDIHILSFKKPLYKCQMCVTLVAEVSY